MKHTYNILGMTCSGCADTVSQRLSKADGVLRADVLREENKVEIEMSRHVATAELQKALGDGKYRIYELGAPAPPPVEKKS